MIGFIIAVAAGFFTPQIDSMVAAPLTRMLKDHIVIAPSEQRLVAFMVAMLGAGIAAAIFYSGTAFWVTAGGVLGYFGARIISAIKKVLDARNNAA